MFYMLKVDDAGLQASLLTFVAAKLDWLPRIMD